MADTTTHDPPSADEPAREPAPLLGDAAVAALARWGIALGTVAAALVVALLRGGATAMLVLAGGTLLGAIALFWASLRSIVDDDGETREVAAVDPLDARHTMLLRQLKDLDAEHALGRTEDADYKDMVARVRADLKAVLRQQDARIAPFETDAEALLARARASKKARRAVAAASDAAAATEPSESSAADEAPRDDDEGEGEGEDVATSGAEPESDREGEGASDAASDAKAERACPSCKTPNDTDAVFCKKCGTRLGEREALARAEAGDDREEDA